jgi:hypothetical protein
LDPNCEYNILVKTWGQFPNLYSYKIINIKNFVNLFNCEKNISNAHTIMRKKKIALWTRQFPICFWFFEKKNGETFRSLRKTVVWQSVYLFVCLNDRRKRPEVKSKILFPYLERLEENSFYTNSSNILTQGNKRQEPRIKIQFKRGSLCKMIQSKFTRPSTNLYFDTWLQGNLIEW